MSENTSDEVTHVSPITGETHRGPPDTCEECYHEARGRARIVISPNAEAWLRHRYNNLIEKAEQEGKARYTSSDEKDKTIESLRLSLGAAEAALLSIRGLASQSLSDRGYVL